MKKNKKPTKNINIKNSLPTPITDIANIPVPYDALKTYLNEISKYPLLSPEEEKEAVIKMKRGDIEAAKKLVTSNLRLVVKIAFEYKNNYQNIMDLIQEGNIGLMKAISMYEPEKGSKLSYYASWWIKSYVLKFLIDNFRLIKIGTTQSQKKLFYNLMQEKRKIENEGKIALSSTLSDRLSVKEKDVIEMSSRLSGSAEISMDQTIIGNNDDDSNTTILSTYEDNSMRPDLLVEEQDTRQHLRDKLESFAKTLNEKEKSILKERLLSETPKTLQEIADNYGISKERTRQLEARILKRLKDNLADLN